MTTSTTHTLHQRIEDACVPIHLASDDQTSHPAGHEGNRAYRGGPDAVRIVSGRFEGLLLVERHRRVCAAVGDLMKQAAHAPSMGTLTPDDGSVR
ncbi:MAG: BolA/IbaG family iron-sulfur metabolism protein [Candidatus Marinimicrobia bacterium]|nr:BolA/IbaG family iron-sulfur metabolism protein [Candidatus Neomarinimicrobiota bacterium]